MIMISVVIQFEVLKMIISSDVIQCQGIKKDYNFCLNSILGNLRTLLSLSLNTRII